MSRITKLNETDDTLSVSFTCPSCGDTLTRTFEKPLDRNERYSCTACQRGHYLFPVIGPNETVLDEMSTEERIKYQLESINKTEELARRNRALATRAVRILHLTLMYLLGATTAVAGFLLISAERTLLLQTPFWVTFALLASSIPLGIMTLVRGPPAQLKQVYEYALASDDIDGVGELLRAVGNYHHVQPFISPRLANLLLRT